MTVIMRRKSNIIVLTALVSLRLLFLECCCFTNLVVKVESFSVINKLPSTRAATGIRGRTVNSNGRAFVLQPSALSSTATSSTTVSVERPKWTFRGHDIYSEVTLPQKKVDKNDNNSQPLPVIVLIHGFACSTTYWREIIQVLSSEGYQVHALDLLGQGKSAKAGRAQGIEYSINLWAELVDMYAKDMIDEKNDVVLMGNSLGSLVALAATTGDFCSDVTTTTTTPTTGNNNNKINLRHRVKGIGMFNCGVGLNSRGIANEEQWTPFQRFLINKFYDLLVLLIFNNRLLLEYVLRDVVTPDLLRNTLQTLYITNPDRVDEELVDSFYLPAKEEGSAEVLSQIYVNDPGKTPVQLHNQYPDLLDTLPIHLVWGETDAVTPLPGGIGQYYTNLAKDSSNNISFESIPDCGHIPFDDNDIPSNNSMLKWLQTL